MDPDWRGISYWTWGIFHCFNAQLGPWKWTPGRVDSYWKPSFFGLGVSFFSLEIFVGNTMTSTLPATDSKSPENWWLEDVIFFGDDLFSVAFVLSFRQLCHLFPPEILEPNQRAPQKWMWPKFIGTNHRYTGDVDSEANLDLYGIGTGVTVSHHLGGEIMEGKNHYIYLFSATKDLVSTPRNLAFFSKMS